MTDGRDDRKTVFVERLLLARSTALQVEEDGNTDEGDGLSDGTPPGCAGTHRRPFDRSQSEREVMAVLDALFDAFNRQDARAEERTYHFPHFRLAGGGMSVLDKPGAETQAWMNATYTTLRQSGWDHTAWTRRRIFHMSDSKVHVDTEVTRYRKDGSVIGSFDSLYILTTADGRWGIKMRSSFETLIR